MYKRQLLILARTQSARGASAHDFARRALTIHQQNGHRLGERQALALLEEWGAVVMPNRLTALIPGPARHPAPSAGVRVPRRRAPGLRLGEAS